MVITEFLMVISLQNQSHTHEIITFDTLFAYQNKAKSDTKISKYNIILCNLPLKITVQYVSFSSKIT